MHPTNSQPALEVVSDSDGSVSLGWVGYRVYYARFVGGLSATLGATHLARLREVVGPVAGDVPLVAYFSDASALEHYDLLARSAFVRLILENRKKFSSLTMLTWSGGITAATEAFAAALGGNVAILRDAAEFDKLLIRAAPHARQKIDPKPLSSVTPPRSARR